MNKPTDTAAIKAKIENGEVAVNASKEEKRSTKQNSHAGISERMEFDKKLVEVLKEQGGVATTTVLRDALQTQLRAPIRRSVKRLVNAGIVTRTVADSKRKTYIIELRNNGRPALESSA